MPYMLRCFVAFGRTEDVVLGILMKLFNWSVGTHFLLIVLINMFFSMFYSSICNFYDIYHRITSDL